MEWIKSCDKKPNDTRGVLVFCPNPPNNIGAIFDAEYEDGEWYCKGGPVSELGEVTHWMELPDPPKDE